MDTFSMYSLPLQGLNYGVRQFTYQLDEEFFGLFEDSPIANCDIQAMLTFDKRPSMLVLTFEFLGKAETDCDRCLASIFVPVKGTHQLHVKFTEDEIENNDEDVIFLSPKTSEFNVAPYLYEFSILSLPFLNQIDCQNEEEPPCNFETLDVLEKQREEGQQKSPWDALLDLDFEDEN